MSFARRAPLFTLLLLMATGCSEPPQAMRTQATIENLEVAAPPGLEEIPAYVPPPGMGSPATTGLVPSGSQQARLAEQIAYSYTLNYRLPSDQVLSVLTAHRKQCAALASACTVVGESRRVGDDGVPRASLSMRVDARQAPAFADRADAAVGAAGGETVGRTVESQNLTTQLVDTDARLRSKELLAQRLETLLRTRQGRVADLVEAERALAEARGDIDSARSQIAAMRRRVAQSDITTEYRGIAAETAVAYTPLRDAMAGIGLTFAESLATMIRFLAALLPWLAILLPLGWLVRRGVQRWRTSRAARLRS